MAVVITRTGQKATSMYTRTTKQTKHSTVHTSMSVSSPKKGVQSMPWSALLKSKARISKG